MTWSVVSGPDQPRLQGHLLCRKDWLQLREIARSEWTILPIQEVAAYPGALCANTSALETALKRAGPSGLTSAGRLAIVVQDNVDGPCTGCPDIRTRTLGVDLDEAGVYCLGVLEPPLWLQPTEPFQPWVHSARAPVSATVVPPWKSPHRVRLAHSLSIVQNSRNCSTRAIISPHAVWNLCSPAAFWFRKKQQRSSNVGASRSRRARRLPCVGRPLGTQHSREGYGELRAQSCERSKKTSNFSHFTSLPCHRLTTSPRQCMFLQNRVSSFLDSATWHLERRLGTFRCTQPAERARNFAPWYSGKLRRSGNG